MKIERIHFEKIDSTNTWGKHHAHSFPRDKMTVVTADVQTEGRGRFQRPWKASPMENITVSFCFFVDENFGIIGNIPQVLSIAAAQTFEAFGLSPKLKWPNDILVSDKKISGILCETVPVENHICIVLGIGVNVNMDFDFLENIDQRATSLRVETGQCFVVNDVLMQLQNCFVQHLQTLFQEGFSPFLPLYKSRFWISPGNEISILDGQSKLEGAFHSIVDDGSINLQLPSGSIKNFHSGSVL